MKWIIAYFTVVGFNFGFWIAVGALRFASEQIPKVLIEFVRRLRSHPRAFLEYGRQTLWQATFESAVSFGLFSLFAVTLNVLLGTVEGWLQFIENFRALTGPYELVLNPLSAWLFFAFVGGFIARSVIRASNPAATAIASTTYFFGSILVSADLIGIVIPLEAPGTLLLLLASFVLMLSGETVAMSGRGSVPTPAQPALPAGRITPPEVAVIMAAHNEEAVIGQSITAAMAVLPVENIYIGSDASTDRTSAVARSYGCQVVDIYPNQGKAKTLKHLLDRFQICDRYRAVLILDADIVIRKRFLDRVLPLFDDPRVAAVPGRSIPRWPAHPGAHQARFITAYRMRLWRMLQFGLRYAQTWRFTNMTTIVPGAMSTYRASVLRQLEIDAPGLVIEDFNMTFELHHKRLGIIAYDLGATVDSTQPLTIGDYVRQVKRWYLGWWQTIWRHGVWPSAFWAFMASFTLEMVIYGLFVVMVPAILLVMAANGWHSVTIPQFLGVFRQGTVSLPDLLLGVFLADYLMTIIITLIERKPALLFYGLGFFVLRFLDALMFITMIPASVITKSDGRWVHPKRKPDVSA
ncbi:MAG: glycosyltransferase family 2 protein [Candidatus Kerfeldbacteria bacterium]|nr:glycosyltransferase family 2 protein [Candidatus Kerfeldbacteria bacterium]